MIEISVVIPVYNSAENLVMLCNQLFEALNGFKYELILVNDRSTDSSWSIISDICTSNTDVIGINLRKNIGQDNAIMAGLNQVHGNFIVIMDDDLQHSPYDIIKLYDACVLSNSDICFANFNSKKQAFWKNIGSWFNGIISELFLKKPKGIYLSPFKIISSAVVFEMIKYKGPYPYIDGLILSVTDNMIQIEIEHYKRFMGSSNFNIVRSVSVFLKHVTTFSVIPLRLASVIGFVFSTIGFLLIPYYVFEYFFTTNIVEGWTTLTILLIIIGGLLLFSLGIIGEYIGRTYLNINSKPQFTIKEVLSDESLF